MALEKKKFVNDIFLNEIPKRNKSNIKKKEKKNQYVK